MHRIVAVEVHGLQVLVEFHGRKVSVHATHRIGAQAGDPPELLPMIRADAIRAAESMLPNGGMPREALVRFTALRATCTCGHHDPTRADVCPGCCEPRSS